MHILRFKIYRPTGMAGSAQNVDKGMAKIKGNDSIIFNGVT